MNILFLTENDIEKVVGGVERVTRLLADQFRKNGHQIICVSSGAGTLSRNIFAKLLADNNTDIIINQNFTDSHYKLLKYKPKGIKVFSVLHNRPFQHEGLGKKFKEISYPTTLRGKIMKFMGVNFPDFYIAQRRKATKRNISRFVDISDKLIVLCEDYKNRILKFIPQLDPTKIDVIPNPNTFEPCQANFEKENLILFVGRLENPQKNVTDFIQIWKLFHEGNPDWKAKIIGDGPHRTQFEEYSKKLGVSDLEFVGSSDTVQNYYSRAKLLCMTSLYEGWPMTLPEAISCGCLPVLYNSFEAAPIILGKRNKYCIIPPFDKELMVKVLTTFAKNDTLREETLSQIQTDIIPFSLKNISSIWIKKLGENLPDGRKIKA